MKKISSNLRLKHLFLAVVGLAFLLSLVSSVYSSYKGNVNLLKNQSLETNRVYAEKLAQTVNIFLLDSLQKLEFSSEAVADSLDNVELLRNEAERVQKENKIFNSVAIADKNGNILAGAPKVYHLEGKTIASKEGLEQIKNQKPVISDPYLAATGNYLVTISHPIFSKNGEYQGVINGTIYLHESNFLQSILGEHTYKDGSYVYVVDSQGKIIYHQMKDRIGEDVSRNDVVRRLTEGEIGSQRVVNTMGVDMLAGYSKVEATDWGVVAQTPYESAIASIDKEVLNMLYIELPLIFFSMIIVIIFVRKIVNPLQSIAEILESSSDSRVLKKLNHLNTWYFEASKIKKALIQSLSILHGQVSNLKDQSSMDPLTRLLNRRALDSILKTWTTQNKSFSIVMLDIDHFKSVNDTFGHAVGDEVLKYLADEMKHTTREHDVCCRFGGEEFLILLPETTIDQAYLIAERFRIKIENMVSPCGRPITFSAGVASYPGYGDVTNIIKQADEALYFAKHSGRNNVKIYDEKELVAHKE